LVFFFRAGGQSAQGSMLVYPRGGWWNTEWLLMFTCWSAKCLPSKFGDGIWWRRRSPVLSV
jgi:hypothetical protein